MAEIKTKKKKKIKIKATGIILILVIVAIIYLVINAVFSLPIKHIYITGTTYITDNEIITECGIKDYPSIYKLNLRKMKESILTNPLVKDVTIKRNLFGKLTIDINEEKVMFLNRSNNTLVISEDKEIPNTYSYTKIPTLINIVPDEIYKELISGLYKVDYDIVSSISEIEYSPSKNTEGEIIDDQRFYLRMNDGNAVIMNVVNIKRLNSYNTIFASVGNQKGTMHLDSIFEESIYFKSFELEKQELEEQNKKEDNGENANETPTTNTR
ncbi:MAG: cell division protein FtsQ/DivIB [Bacilli bacterium]